jgi:hypothetical protein
LVNTALIDSAEPGQSSLLTYRQNTTEKLSAIPKVLSGLPGERLKNFRKDFPINGADKLEAKLWLFIDISRLIHVN